MRTHQIILLLLFPCFLLACNPPKSQLASPAASSLIEDCKKGRAATDTCNRAQAAEAYRVHREAEDAFRNMSEGR